MITPIGVQPQTGIFRTATYTFRPPALQGPEMPENPAVSPLLPHRSARRSVTALLVVPLFLFVVIGWVTPNFVDNGLPRDNPLGGDFLQEYAGGVLFLDLQNNRRLYRSEAFRRVQHDAQVIGFSWNENKYFPVVYPPFYYAAVSPLSRLEYLTAARLWLLLMTGCLAGSLLVLRRCLPATAGWLLLACLTAPLLLSLSSGQKSSLLLLILTGTWALLHQRRPFTSGMVFGMIAFKPHLGIPVGLFMLVTRQWRFVGGCALTVSVLIAASLLTGLQNCSDYVGVVTGFADYVHHGGYHLEQGFSLWSFWQLAVGDDTLARIATLVCGSLVLGVTARSLSQPAAFQGDNLSRSFSAMTIATVLVAPHLYAYDLTMLLLPAILLGEMALRQPRQWLTILPLIALAILLFGMQGLVNLAAISRLNAGVPLMLGVWALTLIALKPQPADQTTSRWATAAAALDLKGMGG
jgi:hypothetical protein